jgi:uncharacterized membrane protein required for colicin V production
MNIIDALIILIILAVGINGLKNGVLKQLVSTVGFILMIIIAFYLKNPIADFLSLHLPFFKFGGSVIASFNILLYQSIAFLIVVGILEAILGILIKISGLIEKILKFTIILGIPSKILGFIVGIIEGFAIVFLALFILKQPQFNIGIINESTLGDTILYSTPVLSDVSRPLVDTINDTYNLIMQKKEEKITDTQLDYATIELMLKHKIITPEYVRKLVDKNKIKLDGIDALINEYSK